MLKIPMIGATALLLLTSCAMADDDQWDSAPRRGSGAYQEGYRDGYREGYRAALREAARGGSGDGYFPSNSGIRIRRALYGDSVRYCDFSRKLQAEVNGKSSYEFEVSNRLCGDPARDTPKRALIEYSCGNRGTQRIEVGEEQRARLYCPW